jgi:MFS family permease
MMLNNLTPEQLTPAQRWMILFSSSFGGFFVTFMTSGINVGLPDIGRQFNLSGVYLNWISLSMVLVSAAVLLPMGRLADTYGRIRFFVGGMVVFSAASFACALAPSANALLAFRMVTGIGLAIGSVTAPALVILAYPFEKRGQALGWNVLGVYLGITVGPFLGGLIFRNLDWRAFFYILGAVNLVNVPCGSSGTSSGRNLLKGGSTWPGRGSSLLGWCACSSGFRCCPQSWVWCSSPSGSWGWPASCGGRRGRPIRCCRFGCSRATACSAQQTPLYSSTTGPLRP